MKAAQIVRNMLKLALILAGIVIVLGVGFIIYVIEPGPSGVVASLRLKDGSEYMVTQTCNYSPEPYTVSFYLRSKDGPWGWCYIDHQASRWHKVKMTYDDATDTITIFNNGTAEATLDRKASQFSLRRSGPGTARPAPQEKSAPPYPFPE